MGLLAKFAPEEYDALGREPDEGTHVLTVRRVIENEDGGLIKLRFELVAKNSAPFSKFITLYPESQSKVKNEKAKAMDPETYEWARLRNLEDAKRLCYAFTGKTDCDSFKDLEGASAELYVYRRAPRGDDETGRLDVRLPYISTR